MPIVEVDEVELLNLRRLQGVASKIMSNPKGKKLLEMAHKEVDPSAVTPALDQEALINEPINKAVDEVKALKAELKAEREEREKAEKLSALNKQVNDGFAELRKSGWQEDGIKAVDALMQEKGILDPAIAAAYIEKTMPQQQPANPSGGSSWNFMEKPADTEIDLKTLMDNRGDGPVVDKMAHAALLEFRGQSRR